MTKNENFKHRVRLRMSKTGERYAAARQSLIDQASPTAGRTWVSDPEMSDESVRASTGCGWDEWCDLIDAWPGRIDGHPAIAAYLRDERGVDPWWSQAVTVGYERITGLRLPHERPDGTFTADKSKTIAADADQLRAMLLSSDDRDQLFGGTRTELRSKPESKGIRIAVGPGVALISLEAKADHRTKVVVSHRLLPTPGDVAEWKFFWDEWLTALDES